MSAENSGDNSNPVVIRSREQLIFMLSEASTLEHMVMCQYLFASFALKRNVSEGITPEQLEAVRRWDRVITEVAEEEMKHLSLANNLLTAIGAAPHFGRPNFPLRSRYFPSSVRLALMPLDDVSLRFYLYLERPENVAVADVPGFDTSEARASGEEIVPEGQMFATIGQLYRGIEEGLKFLVENYGEKAVFIGSPESQATAEHFGWKELISVTDMQSAQRAIDSIVTEGEGARGDWKEAHFGKFLGILNEYTEIKAKDPAFNPSRPALAAFTQLPGDAETAEIIDDELTGKVSDLFNASYELLLQMLSRYFLQVETTNEELHLLAGVSIRLMVTVIKPLGTLLTTMPVGPHRPGLTAGATFEMYRMSYLLPRSRAAWAILRERLLELTGYCSELSRIPTAPKILLAVEKALGNQAKAFENFVTAPA